MWGGYAAFGRTQEEQVKAAKSMGYTGDAFEEIVARALSSIAQRAAPRKSSSPKCVGTLSDVARSRNEL
jgi:hypothetical protein